MRWRKLIERYSLVKRPILRVDNPRMGTAVIPLDEGDDLIFFQYLTNKIHALTFEGTEVQLTKIIYSLQGKKGFKIQKMKTGFGRGRERLMLVHLKFDDDIEIRRLIKIS